MSIQASVVVPTYNRAHQLLLTLTSFEHQSFPKDSFEVIVVNDGSDDATREVLANYRAPYNLRHISTVLNKGRSAARNLGVKAARGEIIIFCDADFLVRPNFISTHVRYHSLHDKAVVSGVPESWVGAYTHYYPEFADDQKRQLREVLQRANLWDDAILQSDQIVDIITPEDVRENIDKVDRVVAWYMDRQAKEECRRLDVAPWLVFITRCVSVKYEDFHRAGGFNEEFIHYGLEDWELGYRLSKDGVSFVCMDEMLGYHQEHPISYRGIDGNRENLKVIYERHGVDDPELAFISITPPWSDFHGYKHNLRKLRALLGDKHATPPKNVTNPIELQNETMSFACGEAFSVPAHEHTSMTKVPVYFWSLLPKLDKKQFSQRVVISHNGVPDCMWVGQRPYGGWGEPNGLVFFRTTFQLECPADVRIEVPYVDDMALVYIDDQPIVMRSTHENLTLSENSMMPEYRTISLDAGEHVVTVEAINAYPWSESNRAGILLSIVNMDTGRMLASSSNPPQWKSTGYVSVPPTSWYQQCGVFQLQRKMWNVTSATFESSDMWTVHVTDCSRKTGPSN
jgi:glycosyltransferase involved in cell wall biosynthesis